MRVRGALSVFMLTIAGLAGGAAAQTVDIQPLKGGIPEGYSKTMSVPHGRISVEKAMQRIAESLMGNRTAKRSDRVISFEFQWPGIYIETEFSGTEALIDFNNATDAFKIYIDGIERAKIVRPNAVIYRLSGLAPGKHRLRIEKINESQDTVGSFGDVWLPYETQADQTANFRPRQIEFIGDSSSVGYGNTSATRTCTKEEVWATTDTSQAYPILTAKHYGADYQLNAFSGRGIVRNYDGVAAGEPLPVLYPYILFDRKTEYANPTWQPQIIVIGLGGNDFSTPVHAGEKWANQDALKADYQASYVAFVKALRAKNPKAFFILTSNDGATVDVEVQKVVAKLKADGETRLDYIGMKDFGRKGCDWHFDLNDHNKIFGIFTAYFDAHPELWQGK
jgi:lysophospholipase L1-like esterase